MKVLVKNKIASKSAGRYASTTILVSFWDKATRDPLISPRVRVTNNLGIICTKLLMGTPMRTEDAAATYTSILRISSIAYLSLTNRMLFIIFLIVRKFPHISNPTKQTSVLLWQILPFWCLFSFSSSFIIQNSSGLTPEWTEWNISNRRISVCSFCLSKNFRNIIFRLQYLFIYVLHQEATRHWY